MLYPTELHVLAALFLRYLSAIWFFAAKKSKHLSSTTSIRLRVSVCLLTVN